MANHEALQAGRVASILGAADGIGLAACKRYAELGMKVCMADVNADQLAKSAAEDVQPLLAGGAGDLLTEVVDVADRAKVEAFREQVYERFGRTDVLMNNAGIPRGGEAWEQYDAWREIFEVNLWGQIHGVAAFVPKMIEQNTPALVVNTGSKQGITSPPGSPPYNITKAAVRAFTENLAHSLRNTADCKVTAHLLVPGFTYTGLMRPFLKEKPDSAWWPEQVIDYMIEKIEDGRFYILCPDNDVTEEMDAKRMLWSIGDLVEGRPALSRWHPDWKDAFERFTSE